MFEQFRRAVIVAAFVLGGLFVFVPLAASAHTKFLGSAPASGVELQRAPDVVTLRFKEDAQIDVLRVTDAHGVNRASAPYHPGGDTRLVEVKTPSLDRGSYIVTWQVTADDGHVGEGRFAFGVGVPAGVVPAGGEPGIAGSGIIVAVLRFALLAGIVIGTGLAFGALLTVRAPNVAPVSMLEFGAWIVVAFVAFIDIRVQGLITGESLPATLNTRYGVLHLTLMIAAFLGAIAVSGGKRRWELLITAMIAVLLGESLGGHAGTGVLPAAGRDVRFRASACGRRMDRGAADDPDGDEDRGRASHVKRCDLRGDSVARELGRASAPQRHPAIRAFHVGIRLGDLREDRPVRDCRRDRVAIAPPDKRWRRSSCRLRSLRDVDPNGRRCRYRRPRRWSAPALTPRAGCGCERG